MYENGSGVPKDDYQAVQWYQKAANQNEPNGLYILARMYEMGRGGLSPNRQAAINYYQRAAKLGQANAKEALQRLSQN